MRKIKNYIKDYIFSIFIIKKKMSSIFHLLTETLSIIVNNSMPTIGNGMRMKLIKNISRIDTEVKDTLIEIAIHDGLTRKRMDNIEYEIELLKNKNSNEERKI